MFAIVGTNAILDRDLLGFERLPIRSNFVQFLWLPGLGEPDQCILPILSALSTWVMSRQTSNGATGALRNNKDYDNLYAFIHWLHFFELPIWARYLLGSFNVFQLIQQHFIYKNLNAK